MLKQISLHLKKYYKSKLKFSFYTLFLKFIFILFSTLFLLISFENIFYFGNSARKIFYYILLIELIGILIFISVYFLKYYISLKKFDIVKIALEVGNYFDEIKDRLSNAIQLYLKDSNNPLIVENLHIILNKINLKDVDNIIDTKPVKKQAIYINIFIIVFLLLYLTPFYNGFHRIINYNLITQQEKRFKFVILNNSKYALNNTDYTIFCKIYDNKKKTFINEFFQNAKIYVKEVNQPDFIDYKIQKKKYDTLLFTLKNITSNVEYYLVYNGERSDIYDINVINEPLITKLELVVTPPTYTKLPSFSSLDNGNIQIPNGSKVNFNLLASEELMDASIVTNYRKIKLNIDNNYWASNILTISNDFPFHISIKSKYGIYNKPINYTIKVINDEYPKLNVILPNKPEITVENNRLETFLNISDDYGLSKLLLNYRASKLKYEQGWKTFKQIKIPIEDKAEQTVNYIWNFSNLSLVPGEEIEIFFEIFDNDQINGNKSTKSGIYKIRIPDLQELYSDVEKNQEQIQNKIEKTIKEFNEVKEEFEKIKKDIKQDKKELTWQEKERIEKAVDKYEKVMKKMEEIRKEFSEIKNKNLENNLLSKETLEKYLELQNLMKEFTSDEYKKALEKLQKSLQNNNRNLVQNDLKNFEFNEEMFKKSIERTLNLFKRLQIEQKTDEILKRVDDLNKKLDQINEQLSSNSSKDNILKQQQELKNELKNLQKQMKNLQDKMKEFKDLPNDMLSDINDKFNQENNDELMENSMQATEQGNYGKSLEIQNKLKNNLKNFGSNLSSMRQQMINKNQQETLNKILKIISNLYQITENQENLRNKTRHNSINYNEFNNLAIQQNNLLEQLNKVHNIMTELAQKSFLITPEIANNLGTALNEMKNSINTINSYQIEQSIQSQNLVIKNLNELSKLLNSALKNMAKGNGGGSGAMSLMQQFQQLIQQQMQINNITQKLANGEQLSQEELQLAQRLQQQQELIKKSLEQLNQEAKSTGQSKKLPSNLDKLMEDIQEVINDIKSKNIDDKLVQKQEKILSRMLDATKSINDRDYEEKREAELSQRQYKGSQNSLKFQDNKYNEPNSIESLKKEGIKEDYLKLIRKYFEIISK